MSYTASDAAAISRERTIYAASRVDDIADWATEQALTADARGFYLDRAVAIRWRADHPPDMDRAALAVRRIIGGR